MRILSAIGFLGVWFSLCCCGTSLQHVPRGAHLLSGGAEPVVVDSAPPPALIDEIPSPDPPEPGCAWADGRFIWSANRWLWEPGQWVRVPPDCYYADSLIVWVPSVSGGALFYTHGQWYKRDQSGTCRTPKAC